MITQFCHFLCHDFFSEKTYFTFGYSGLSEIDASISIYSLNGEEINKLHATNLSPISSHFYRMPENGWNGKDYNDNDLANGTYIYYLKITSEEELIHENIYKVTKLK